MKIFENLNPRIRVNVSSPGIFFGTFYDIKGPRFVRSTNFFDIITVNCFVYY